MIDNVVSIPHFLNIGNQLSTSPNYLKEFLFLIIILAILILSLSLWGFYQGIFPSKLKSTITPKMLGINYENISFHTKDNVLIKGWFLKSPHPHAKTIILLHGYPADKGDILPARIFLYPKYNLFFIDFRYLGESGGGYSTAGKNEVYDLLGAIEHLNQRGIHQVVVWGFSMGGAVALMAAPHSSAIKAVIAESSYANLNKMTTDYFHVPLLKYPLGWLLRFWAWVFLGYDTSEVSPLNSAASLNIPILIIHSKSDHVVPFSHATLFEKKLSHKKNVEFIFYDAFLHGEEPPSLKPSIEHFLDNVKNWN
jgi:dipeptidyl aminopeptidase/acylaminoacyl peptidase